MFRFREWLNRGERPNKFTRAVGERIRQAREERGMSQSELAERTYRTRPSISEMETGKMEPDASTLVYLSTALDKPIMYFYPVFARGTEGEAPPPEAQELLNVFLRLDPQLQRAAIRQVRALAELDDE